MCKLHLGVRVTTGFYTPLDIKIQSRSCRYFQVTLGQGVVAGLQDNFNVFCGTLHMLFFMCFSILLLAYVIGAMAMPLSLN